MEQGAEEKEAHFKRHKPDVGHEQRAIEQQQRRQQQRQLDERVQSAAELDTAEF